MSPELAPATAPVLAPATKIVKKRSRMRITSLFAPTCQNDINEFNASLDEVKATFSATSGCKAVLDSSREYECLTTIDNCRIKKIQLLNADTDGVVTGSFASGMSFCSSVPVAFRAINDPCVCNVQFNLKNSSGLLIHNHFAYHEPYVSFYHGEPNAGGQVNIYGKKLAAGTYSLDYYPDSVQSLLKTITFTVKNC